MKGYERLKELYKKGEEKNIPLINIIKFLLKQEGMNDKYLQEEKTLKEMMLYINKKAKKESINNVAVIEEDKVYKWALEYFVKSNIELGINNKLKTEQLDMEI